MLTVKSPLVRWTALLLTAVTAVPCLTAAYLRCCTATMYTVLGTDRCTRTNLRSANMCNLINVFILYLWDFCKTARLAEIPKYLINLYTLLNAILADNFPVFGEKIKNTPWKTFIYYLPLPPLLVLYTLNTLPVHWTPSLYTLDPLPVYTRHPTCIPWTPYPRINAPNTLHKLKSCTVPFLYRSDLVTFRRMLYRPDVCNCTMPYVHRTVPAYAVQYPA